MFMPHSQMTKEGKNQFKPDYKVHPGITLQEILEEKNISIRQASFMSNVGLMRIGTILTGQSQITEDIAEKFEKAFGPPKTFWINLSRGYYEKD